MRGCQIGWPRNWQLRGKQFLWGAYRRRGSNGGVTESGLTNTTATKRHRYNVSVLEGVEDAADNALYTRACEIFEDNLKIFSVSEESCAQKMQNNEALIAYGR